MTTTITTAKLAWLLLRRNRLLVGAWSVLLVGVSAGTLSSYQSAYPTPEQRRLAVELAQHNAATTLVYGRLADPGTPALMYVWETGAIVTILASALAVLLGVGLTRATEDDGTLELVRSCGVNPRTPLRSACAVLTVVASVLAIGCSLAVAGAGADVEGVTWPGALAFGLVVGLTFLLFAAVTVVLAQVFPTAGGARVAGALVVGAAFALRAVADTQQVGWLNWLTPLGLRATVAPFAGNRWWVLACAAVPAVGAGWLAGWLSDRREYGAGMLPQRRRREVRLVIRSGFGLSVRLARRSTLIWTIAVAVLGTLFSAMGSGAVRSSEQGSVGGFLGSQLGTQDPVAGYLAYSGTVIGIVTAAFAVLGVLQAGREEADGLTDHLLAAGVRRWQPLAWQVTVTAVGGAALVLVTGLASALVAPVVIEGTDVGLRAFAYCVGQWPAVVAAAGWTALLVGVRPRWSWTAWVPLVVSSVFALLGQLLGIPRAVRDLGILQHVPDVSHAGADVGGLVVLLAVGGCACLVGLVGTTRRDVAAG